jgi:hypothetical protein
MFIFIFLYFLLGIFLIYISNAIPKVPHTLPPHSPTHPLPLFGPGVPLYWGSDVLSTLSASPVNTAMMQHEFFSIHKIIGSSQLWIFLEHVSIFPYNFSCWNGHISYIIYNVNILMLY